MSTNPEQDLPTTIAIENARRVFESTLAAWAQDLLLARSQGLLSLSWCQTSTQLEESWALAA